MLGTYGMIKIMMKVWNKCKRSLNSRILERFHILLHLFTLFIVSYIPNIMLCRMSQVSMLHPDTGPPSNVVALVSLPAMSRSGRITTSKSKSVQSYMFVCVGISNQKHRLCFFWNVKQWNYSTFQLCFWQFHRFSTIVQRLSTSSTCFGNFNVSSTYFDNFGACSMWFWRLFDVFVTFATCFYLTVSTLFDMVLSCFVLLF